MNNHESEAMNASNPRVPRLSFEFFPPKTETQARRFWRSYGALETLHPDFVSVTWGALGAASEASLAVLEPLVQESLIPIAAHLTCAGQTADEMRATLDRIEALGIFHIVALRGDPSALRERNAGRGEKTLKHASELVELIAERGGFDISVSAYPEVHPEASDADSDLHWLKRKFELGASRAITQFFFDADIFLRWRDRASAIGIDRPIVPGILPVHDIDKVANFAAQCGANVPDGLRAKFADVRDDRERRALAIDECVALCGRLIAEGVEDIHLYTMNQSNLAHAVATRLSGVERAAPVGMPVAA